MRISGFLAIFLTLTLIVLAAFSVTTARSNLSYSKNVREWHEQFYEIDADAQRLLMFADESLKEAFTLYNSEPGESYLTIANRRLEDGKQSFMRSLLSVKERTADWEGPDRFVFELTEGGVVTDLKLEATFFAESNKNYHLTVTLDVLPLSRIDVANGRFYEIVEWRQWQ